MFAILQAAGWPIWPLLACSVLALALILERHWSLRTARVAPPALVNDLDQFDAKVLPGPETADKLHAHSLLGQVLAAGLRAVQANPLLDDQGLRNAFESAGRNALHQMERNLSALGTIATAAPLLGLLGTVVGMIEIFGSQAPSGGNPAQLAHGISIALYNTAFGLIVAIPALVAHRHFKQRVVAHELTLANAAERLYAQLLRHTHRAQAGANGR